MWNANSCKRHKIIETIKKQKGKIIVGLDKAALNKPITYNPICIACKYSPMALNFCCVDNTFRGTK